MALELSIVDFTDLTDQYYFKRLKSYLIDKNIYDVGYTAIPYSTTPLTLRISGDAGTYHIVLYRKDNNDVEKIVVDTSFTGSSYDVDIERTLGDTSIELDVNSVRGNAVSWSCYNIHTFLYTFAEKFLEYGKDQLQNKQDLTLVDGSVEGLDETFNCSSRGISNFGKLYQAFFLDRFGDGEAARVRVAMLDFVYHTVIAYANATTKKAIDLLIEGLYGDTVFPVLVDYYKQRNFYPTVYDAVNPYRRGKLYISGADIIWDEFVVYQGGRLYTVPGGTQNIAALADLTYHHFYFDGSPVAAPVVLVSATAPVIGKYLTANTFVIADISTDDVNGTITGAKYGKYVELSQIPYNDDAIDSVTNTGAYDLDTDGRSVSIVSGTNFAYLGTSEDTGVIGTVTVNFYADREVFLLGRFIRDGANYRIDGCFRVSEADSVGGDYKALGLVSRSIEMWQNGFNLFIPYVITTDYEKAMLLNLISILKPAHKRGYVFCKDTPSDFPRDWTEGGVDYEAGYFYNEEGYVYVGEV